MKIVFLDRSSVGLDVDISIYEKFGTIKVYDYSEPHDIKQRIFGSDIVITNKAPMDESTLSGTSVRLICLTATGADNVDHDFCRKSGITVCNVKGYSTNSVVQHTFALLFMIWERMTEFIEHTRNGRYVGDTDYSHYAYTFREMTGKTFGVMGMGAIGSAVAKVAETFGFNVIYWSSSDMDRNTAYRRVGLEELLRTCDVISINSPLNEQTRGLLGIHEFEIMKPETVVINTGRGAIIVEEDIVQAIENGMIGGAALDVITKEPMTSDSPFTRILDRPNFILTPHVAWAAVESRQRCLDEVCLNIESWIEGRIRNVIV
ncbi:MAG: NAD(P)-dependent oxidoreductase [Eubacteriales bacterium]|jgi:glycerate dehydrogenase|nr:NAD(P)-dependent oxidoreductase [Eubacteriales bacterium]MDD4327273.1 NAD(P)-dependent oxidoreductase [Eubacteriales bacterium]MDD4716869.1 NAD(P)-dependent oxidoreductase [Eubacteriales bacterium]